MKLPQGSPLLFSLTLLYFTAVNATAQSLSDALDTPGLTWTPSGTVTPLNDSALSHDGVDVVRIDAANNPGTGGPYPSIKTTVTVPSVVEFWHRSQDLIGKTVLGRHENIPTAVSSTWKQARWVQFPPNPLSSGELQFTNRGESGSGPLYIDEVTLRPAAVVTLAEALDFPGFTGSSPSVTGLAEGWLAPDGVDAVVFTDPASYLESELTGPALYRFRHGGGDAVPSVRLTPSAGGMPPAMTLGDTSLAWVRATGSYRFQGQNPSSQPSLRSQVPVAMDALAAVPEVGLSEALDAPGLTFSASGIALGIGPDSGAADGDAVILLKDPETLQTESVVSLTVSTPCLVRFSWLGYPFVMVGAQPQHDIPNATEWQTIDIPVKRAGETIRWMTSSPTGWMLNAVSLHPLPPELSIAALLNAPDVVPEVLVPAVLTQTEGQTAEDPALSIAPETFVPLQPVFRLPFTGPSVVSLLITDYYKTALVRIDGGVWQRPHHNYFSPFTAIVPGSGPHTLEVTGPVVLDRFEVVPLESVPLAEALDAPGLIFTTSPAFPWSAYKVPPSLGLFGDHAAFGGSHATAGDPWIETQVTGPGVFQFMTGFRAEGTEDPEPRAYFPKMFINGAETEWMGIIPYELLLGAGSHTVRWVQSGSQVNGGAGTLAFLDNVSLTPIPPLSYNDALETPGRTWITGGGGEVIAAAWAARSPDSVDSVHLLPGPSENPPWIETLVNLPCRLSFRGRDIKISTPDAARYWVGTGPGNITILPGFTSFSNIIRGSGPALLRFTGTSADSVLDAVEIEEPEASLLSSINLGNPALTWNLYGGQTVQTIISEATGNVSYRATPEAPIWMETVVNGPGKFAAGPLFTLPDHGNRQTDSGWIPYPGPQRVLVSRVGNIPAGSYTFQSTPAVETWTGAPGIVWSTGGEVPWQSQPGQGVRSGFLWPGETSWLEAAVTGPGEMSWQSIFSSTSHSGHIFCNGTALPSTRSSKLYLGAGTHRVRWLVAKPTDGLRNDIGAMQLLSVNYTTQPSGSISDALSGGLINFEQILNGQWQLIDDPTLPGKAIQGNSSSGGGFRAVVSGPNLVTSMVKMTGFPSLAALATASLPAAAAPFPWLPSRTGTAPVIAGAETFFAQVASTPYPTVSVAEAVDLPDLTWTSGSNPPGLWLPRTDPASAASDPDGLYLGTMQMGDLAYLETTVTGPLNIVTERSIPTGGPIQTGTGAIGMRLLLNGNIVADETSLGASFNSSGASYPALRIPAGTHVLRWEISPPKPQPGTALPVIRRIMATVPTTPLPDVADLLDDPSLKWSIMRLNPTAVTTGTQDGVDALALGAGGGFITFPLSGPGIASFYMKGAGTGPSLTLDEVALPITSSNPATWIAYQIPVPAGPHFIRISAPSSTIVLDQFSYTPLPALTLEEALDAPAGVTITATRPGHTGSAAWPALSDDGTDAVLLMPGTLPGLVLTVPPLSRISLRVRTVIGQGFVGIQDTTSTGISTTWSSKSFSTTTDGGQTSIHLRVNTVPVLLDRLMVFPATTGTPYFPWAAAAGLSGSGQNSTADPDGDGLTNFAEYALGLDPQLSDAFRTGTETVPGLPEVGLFTDTGGAQFLEVRYWRRSALTSVVETATQPEGYLLLGHPGGWAAAGNLPTDTSHPGGWIRSLWRSPDPIVPGTRQFARVRVIMP